VTDLHYDAGSDARTQRPALEAMIDVRAGAGTARTGHRKRAINHGRWHIRAVRSVGHRVLALSVFA